MRASNSIRRDPRHLDDWALGFDGSPAKIGARNSTLLYDAKNPLSPSKRIAAGWRRHRTATAAAPSTSSYRNARRARSCARDQGNSDGRLLVRLPHRGLGIDSERARLPRAKKTFPKSSRTRGSSFARRASASSRSFGGGSAGNIAIFSKATGSPRLYFAGIGQYYCGYDDAGNLYCSGMNNQQIGLVELPYGGESFLSLAINGETFGYPSRSALRPTALGLDRIWLVWPAIAGCAASPPGAGEPRLRRRCPGARGGRPRRRNRRPGNGTVGRRGFRDRGLGATMGLNYAGISKILRRKTLSFRRLGNEYL